MLRAWLEVASVVSWFFVPITYGDDKAMLTRPPPLPSVGFARPVLVPTSQTKQEQEVEDDEHPGDDQIHFTFLHEFLGTVGNHVTG
jgi:hypothetical protein